MNRKEHIRQEGNLEGVRLLYSGPEGKTYGCPRCGNTLLLVAEHAFAELWECAQCGYSKQVKQ
jgi:ribosomal protein S27AE